MTRSTKLMACGIVLSAGWFVFSACDCDSTKEENFPGFWVSCIGNKPTLMTYSGDNPTVVTSDPAGSFNPADFDCSQDTDSPPQGKGQGALFKTASPSGPGGYLRGPHPQTTATNPATFPYLPQLLRDLPFVPNVPPTTAPAPCDSTYPDMFRINHLENSVTRFGTCPFTIKAVIPVQAAPLQVEVTPDGTLAIATSFSGSVNFISTATNQVVYTLNTDPSINPQGIAISPDGTTAYVTSFNTNFPAVIVINIPTHQVVANILTSMPYPSGETISPDGSQLWVTSTLANGVDVIDLRTNTRVTTLNIGLATLVAFNSTGTRAYITSASPNPGVAGLVFVVNTQTYQILSNYTVGQYPTDILMSYGDQFLVVNNTGDGTISVIDLIQNKVKTTGPLGNYPTGLTWVH